MGLKALWKKFLLGYIVQKKWINSNSCGSAWLSQPNKLLILINLALHIISQTKGGNHSYLFHKDVFNLSLNVLLEEVFAKLNRNLFKKYLNCFNSFTGTFPNSWPMSGNNRFPKSNSSCNCIIWQDLLISTKEIKRIHSNYN